MKLLIHSPHEPHDLLHRVQVGLQRLVPLRRIRLRDELAGPDLEVVQYAGDVGRQHGCGDVERRAEQRMQLVRGNNSTVIEGRGEAGRAANEIRTR